MKFTIPGQEEFFARHLVLDFNGTIAFDGVILKETISQIKRLAENLKVHVITADTNGSVLEQCRDLPVEVHIIGKKDQDLEKKNFILELQAEGAIAIGNGANDFEMFRAAKLAIAVIGQEGCATRALLESDLVVKDISHGLDLILNENRLIATLRK